MRSAGLDEARARVAGLINAEPKEIFFTSCGTESDNWVLEGTANALKNKGRHIITSRIEHHAILHTCEYLEKLGFEITYLDVDGDGFVSPEALEKAIRKDTILVSIMMVNNEIGTIEPIKELAAVAKAHGVLFHTDAVQGLGNVPVDVKDLGVDFLSMSAHKIYGPKGVGALYMRRGVRITNFMHGGAQETKRRAGTENLAGIAGFGKAAELVAANLEQHIEHCTKLRDYFWERIRGEHLRRDAERSAREEAPGQSERVVRLYRGRIDTADAGRIRDQHFNGVGMLVKIARSVARARGDRDLDNEDERHSEIHGRRLHDEGRYRLCC